MNPSLRTTEPATEQADADGARFALAGRVAGQGPFLVRHSHPVRSARARNFPAKATCARPSTFRQGTFCEAFPAFSRSAQSPATAREMAARRASVAAVWGSGAFVMAPIVLAHH